MLALNKPRIGVSLKKRQRKKIFAGEFSRRELIMHFKFRDDYELKFFKMPKELLELEKKYRTNDFQCCILLQTHGKRGMFIVMSYGFRKLPDADMMEKIQKELMKIDYISLHGLPIIKNVYPVETWRFKNMFGMY